MSEIIQPTEKDDSRVARRFLLRPMGAGALGDMLGGVCTTTSQVSRSERTGGGGLDSAEATPQLENHGTALGTVVDTGGQEGFENPAVNMLVPHEPQPILTGLLMTSDGAVTAQVGLDKALLDSVVNEGVPGLQVQE